MVEERRRMTRVGFALVLLLTLPVSGCTTWTRGHGGPRALLEREQPTLIRVRTADGTSRVARYPRIEDGAIVVDAECRRSPNRRGGYVCPTETVALLDDVTRIDVRRIAWGRTLILLAGLTYVGWGVAFSLAQ